MTTVDEKEAEFTAQNRAPRGWYSIPVRISLCFRKPIHELLKKVQMAECTSIPMSWTDSVVSSVLYWFSIAAMTNYHKFRGFKQYPFIISQFLGLELNMGFNRLKSRFQQGCAL